MCGKGYLGVPQNLGRTGGPLQVVSEPTLLFQALMFFSVLETIVFKIADLLNLGNLLESY